MKSNTKQIVITKTHKAVFKSNNGEEFAVFTFDYRKRLGNLTAGWNRNLKYPVYDGLSNFPIMYPEMTYWLAKEWVIATTSITTSVYRNHKIECSFDNKSSFLFDWFCPICLKQKSYFEGHHVIAKRDGGRNGYENVLDICKTCHQIITYGCIEDSLYMERAAFYHQLMYFGYEGSLGESFLNKHYYHSGLELSTFEENFFQRIIFSFLSPEDEQETLQKKARNSGKFFYQYYRDIALGLRSYKAEMRLENHELYKLFKEEYTWLRV